jgi:hypothetical protein
LKSEIFDSVGMRRFTRLTNAFSKKLENHEHSVALHFDVLQLLPDSSIAARDTSDGSGRDRSRLVNRGGHQLIVRNPAKKE